MDINSGHVVADINQVPEIKRHLYTQIPPQLQEQANRELDGRDSTYINLNRATALADWANKKKRKNRAKAKLAKASRKRNRS